jgi:beta-N-acetylhexosaminidase
MLDAVRSGEIDRKRLDASVLKILKTKAAIGLHKARLVDPGALPSLVGKPENLAEGQRIADAAVTLVRDSGKPLPLKRSGTQQAALPYTKVEEVRNRVLAVIFTEDVRTEAGRTLDRQIRSRVPDARVVYVDSRIADAMSEKVLQFADQAETVVAAAYVSPSAGRAAQVNGTLQNSVALTDANGVLLQKLLERAGKKTVVLAMGNPYLAMDFPAVENYLCAFSSTSVSEVAAVKALFGEIPVHGRLPVTIPGIAALGSGMDRQAPDAQGGQNAHGSSQAH